MNPLSALRDLKAAGLPEPQAAAIVSLWATTRGTATETRRELEALRLHTDTRFDRVESSIAQLNGQMIQMNAQLNGQINQVKEQLTEQMAQSNAQ